MNPGNPQSLPNPGTRLRTHAVPNSCKVCWCFSVESNSFNAPPEPDSQKNHQHDQQKEETNPHEPVVAAVVVVVLVTIENV